MRNGEAYETEFRARAGAISSRIELPGPIPASELDAFVGGLTALVLPYHLELAGGASAMMMRAQEAGVPLVISDTPNLRALVDEANVTLVIPRNCELLASAIADVLANTERHEVRARNEQARVHRENGHQAVGARVIEILRRVGADIAD